jgi:hypothetical protein
MSSRDKLISLWREVFKLPVQIIAVGGSLLLLLWSISNFSIISFDPLDNTGVTRLQIIVAVAIFAVGIGVAAFLWWLSARYFRMVESRQADSGMLASMKDLPMGLPEGTIRALLALVVGVVGLPLLLFSNVVGGNDAIAGYINGIITGVFGFYFGTRTSGVPAAAVSTIAEAQKNAQQQTEAANAVRADAAVAEQRAAQVEQRAEAKVAHAEGVAGFDGMLVRAQRHLVLAKIVVDTFKGTGALPPGLLPDKVDDMFRDAEAVINGLRGITGATATSDQVNELNWVLSTLTGGESPLGSLLGKAAPLLTGLVPSLGPLGGLAMLLGVGVKLGADQFKRWRARVLAAPLAQGLVESGALTPQLARAALERTPALRGLLGARTPAEVDAVLVNALGDELGERVLIGAYGPSGNFAPGIVPEDEATSLIAALQQGLLSVVGAGDIPEDRVTQVKETLLSAPTLAEAAGARPLLDLSEPERAGLRTTNAAQINALIDNVSGASARVEGAPAAAFDALVTLVDNAKRESVDLAQAIAELRQ